MTTKRTKVVTAAEVRAMVEQNWAAWCETDGTNEALAARVKKRLDRNVDETMAVLLGFRKDSWGERWEVDHCNGRAGNSIVGDYIKKKIGAALESWVDSHAGALPELPKAAVAALRTEYVNMYREALRRRLSELARKAADEKAVAMIAALEEAESAAEKGSVES